MAATLLPTLLPTRQSPSKQDFELSVLDRSDTLISNALDPRTFRHKLRSRQQQILVRAGYFFAWCIICNAILVSAAIGLRYLQYRYDDPYTSCYESSRRDIFALDANFGSLSLSSVRTIDLAWNAVIGRGLQGLAAWLMYRVFSNALLRIIEATPVAYDLYLSITFKLGDMLTLFPLLYAVIHVRNFRARLTVVWLLICTTYLVFLPAVIDAMSGYSQLAIPSVHLGNNSTVPFRLFTLTHFDTPQIFNEAGHLSYSSTAYTYNNTSYSSHYLTVNGSCPTQRRTYQWGFSVAMTDALVFTTVGIVLGCYAVWLDAELHSEFRRHGVRLGTFRAATQLAEALIEDLGAHVVMYDDEEIAKHLKRRKLRLRYHVAEKGPKDGEFVLSSSGNLERKFKLDPDREYKARLAIL